MTDRTNLKNEFSVAWCLLLQTLGYYSKLRYLSIFAVITFSGQSGNPEQIRRLGQFERNEAAVGIGVSRFTFHGFSLAQSPFLGFPAS